MQDSNTAASSSAGPQIPFYGRRTVLVPLLIFVNCGISLTIAGSLSSNKDGFSYSHEIACFTMEVVKGIINYIFLRGQLGKARTHSSLKEAFSSRGVFKFAVPAILYGISNNLDFVTHKLEDPVTFQILMNLRIPVTFLFSFLLLGTRYTDVQLASAALLLTGAVLSQSRLCHSLSVSMLGLTSILGSCASSTLAAVYSEKLLKFHHQPVFLQGIQLYVWGAVSNLGLGVA
ncbi:CSTLP1, partial [Symbiodinium sp. KB8]